MSPTSIVYSNNQFIIPVQNEGESLYQEGYGTKIHSSYLIVDSCEVLFLVEKGRGVVINEVSNQLISFQELLQIISKKDEQIWIKYIVYRDLRIRGFVVKAAYETFIRFMLYERGTFLKKPPSYMIYVISEGLNESIENLLLILKDSMVKQKSLKLAVVDRRGEIVYYNLSELDLVSSSLEDAD